MIGIGPDRAEWSEMQTILVPARVRLWGQHLDRVGRLVAVVVDWDMAASLADAGGVRGGRYSHS